MILIFGNECKKIAKLRAETPRARHVNHLNNAGAALMPQRVISRVSKYLRSEAETGCDILSATGRKYLRGPRGTGFLYIRKNLLEKTEPVMLDLHSAAWSRPGSYTMRPDAKRFENWEAGFAGKLGLSEAILYALETGPEEYWQRIQYLAELLRRKLQAAGGITVKDPGTQKCGIVSFECKHKPADWIRDELRKKGINISVTDGQSTLLDSTDRGLGTLCRASVHYYNTGEEIEKFTKELSGMVGR